MSRDNSEINHGLIAYLQGYGRNNRAGLSAIAAFGTWPELTARVNERRMVRFLESFPPAIRRVIYSTNAIESVNAKLRKIIKTRGHFPSDDAAIKLLWLALRTSLNRPGFCGGSNS